MKKKNKQDGVVVQRKEQLILLGVLEKDFKMVTHEMDLEGLSRNHQTKWRNE